MKKCGRELARALFDVKVIVTLCGIILSIAAHEAFHIIIHWGEIDSIHIFPDTQAIVEVIFTPSVQYDLAIEEGIAYTITMITLVLTAMLVAEIHDNKDERSIQDLLFAGTTSAANETYARKQLAQILGVELSAK